MRRTDDGGPGGPGDEEGRNGPARHESAGGAGEGSGRGERRARLAALATPGLGPRRFAALLESYGDAAAALAAARTGEPHPALAGGRGRAWIRAHDDGADRRLEGAARAAGQRIVAPGDAEWPTRLDELHDPPLALFVRGGTPAPSARGAPERPAPAAAVVGARRASSEALDLAAEMGRELAAAGVRVVSGLALGIDGAAHRGALAAAPEGAGTTAVLAGALDRVAPPSHAPLAERIAGSGGAVVSERPPGEGARPGLFPARNRVVAALADAVVVVEAGARSGALITAGLGLELGRAVLAVPGRARDERAAGVLSLLRDGAALALGADDVLAELGWAARREAGRAPPAAPHGASPAALATWRALRELGPAAGTDDLAVRSGLGPGATAAALVELALLGAAREEGPGRWTAL